MKRSPPLLLFFLACSSTTIPPERYGFVALLGNDTVSVEHIARSATRLVTDGVDRWPFVRRRHTEFDLAADGTIRHMVMDVRTPNGRSPRERGRRVTADFSNNRVTISVRDSSGVRDTSFASGGAITVPHVSMMYSVIELEIAAALRQAAKTGLAPGDSVLFRQFYPDRDVGPSFTLHRGYVHPEPGGKVELRHDWLAGTGDVTVDSAGRMLTYSGMRSTYKVAVARTTTLPDVESIGDRLAAAERRTGPQQLSVRDTARATIGAATFSVDYGRPLARGRTLLGNVISFDRVWRTGANAATQFSTSAPITLAGLSLPAGKYTLWAVPHVNGVDLIVNKQIGQWGTEYSRAQDLGTVAMKSDSVNPPVEKFTIANRIERSQARHPRDDVGNFSLDSAYRGALSRTGSSSWQKGGVQMPVSEFVIQTDPAPEQVQYLEDRIYEFNSSVTRITDGEWLAIFVRDDTGQVIAGICGNTWGGCCEIRQFWVEEAQRGLGLGTKLLAAAEHEGRAIASVDDYPRGHQNLLLRKRLG